MSGVVTVLTLKVDSDIRVNLAEPLDVREVDGLGDKDLQCHDEMTTSRSDKTNSQADLILLSLFRGHNASLNTYYYHYSTYNGDD